MGIEFEFDQCVQEIVGRVDVVVDRVVLVPVALHRIGGGPLLSEVDDRIGPMLRQPVLQEFVVAGEIIRLKWIRRPVSACQMRVRSWMESIGVRD